MTPLHTVHSFTDITQIIHVSLPVIGRVQLYFHNSYIPRTTVYTLYAYADMLLNISLLTLNNFNQAAFWITLIDVLSYVFEIIIFCKLNILLKTGYTYQLHWYCCNNTVPLLNNQILICRLCFLIKTWLLVYLPAYHVHRFTNNLMQ